MSAVAIIGPKLTDGPLLDEKAGIVRMKGVFPGTPIEIRFDLIFQAVAGRWRLFGISVQPATVEPATVGTQVGPAGSESSAGEKTSIAGQGKPAENASKKADKNIGPAVEPKP